MAASLCTLDVGANRLLQHDNVGSPTESTDQLVTQSKSGIGGMAQVIECLLYKHEDLSSNSQSTQKKKERKSKKA
jgi:hypothetical protein